MSRVTPGPPSAEAGNGGSGITKSSQARPARAGSQPGISPATCQTPGHPANTPQVPVEEGPGHCYHQPVPNAEKTSRRGLELRLPYSFLSAPACPPAPTCHCSADASLGPSEGS